MAHPKKRTSKARKHKRRGVIKADIPQIAKCNTTGKFHVYHRAYEHEGDIYYRGKVLIKNKSEEVSDK